MLWDSDGFRMSVHIEKLSKEVGNQLNSWTDRSPVDFCFVDLTEKSSMLCKEDNVCTKYTYDHLCVQVLILVQQKTQYTL